MGEMADMALDYAEATESLAYEYTSRGMSLEDAYDNGFVDECGVESADMQPIWDNTPIGSLESLESQLRTAELELDNAILCQHQEVVVSHGVRLNEEALNNLKEEIPTCNICRNSMIAQDGKYGKFYFCRCEGQPTVSDKYWQSVRRK